MAGSGYRRTTGLELAGSPWASNRSGRDDVETADSLVRPSDSCPWWAPGPGIGLNRYRGKRSGAVAASRCAAGSAMLLIEAIRLGLQQEQHHEPIDTWHHAAASTHARGHAPAQARA